MLWREDTAECPDLPAAERGRLGLADLLDYDVVVRPGVVGLKSGALLAGLRFEGPDRETTMPAKLDQLHQALVRALAGFGDGWVLHYDLRRSARPSYPCTSAHADPVSRHLDAVRRRRFEAEGTCFRSTVHLCFSWFPPSERRGALASLATGDADLLRPEHQLEGFERALAELAEQLRPYAAIERLGTAALLRHLHTCVSGLEHPIASPAAGVFLDQLLASQDLTAGTRLAIGERHVVPIGFFGAPERELLPGALDFLAGVPATFRYAARVIFLDAVTAQARIAAIRSEWARTGFDWRQIINKLWGGDGAESERARARLENRFATRMAEDAAEALAEALGGERFAIVTPAVLVEGATRAEAEEGAAELLGALRNAGLPARVETLNALQSWLAQLPGNAWCNRRKLLLSTTAAAALLPQTSVWMGSERCPHPDWAGRPPLAVVATASRESFCLNLHVGDVGHTLVFGPTGTGKSVLLNFLIASFHRYGERTAVYSFDVGLSQLAHCLAVGGVHYHLGEDGLQLAPLARFAAEPGELAASLEWVQELAALQGVRVEANQLDSLQEALGQLAAMPAEYRTLTHLQAKIQSPELRSALRPYTAAGPYGYLLDGAENHLAAASLVVFEMGRLLKMKEPAVVPVLLHLFEEIRRRLDGRPTLILVEEGSVFLRNTRFAREIGDWLIGLRKLGAAVVFVTQSVQHLLDSQWLPIFLESCPTKIFLPNPKLAGTATLRAAYEAIGLGTREIELISNATPSRDYFLTSPAGSRLFRLELSPAELALFGVSRPQQIEAVRRLVTEHGSSWVSRWFSENGLNDDAASLAAERSA